MVFGDREQLEGEAVITSAGPKPTTDGNADTVAALDMMAAMRDREIASLKEALAILVLDDPAIHAKVIALTAEVVELRAKVAKYELAATLGDRAYR